MDFSTLMQQASANQQYTEKKVNRIVKSAVYINVYILVNAIFRHSYVFGD